MHASGNENVTASSPVSEQVTDATSVNKISKSAVTVNTSFKQCDQLTVYPENTFYGLPESVFKYLKEFKGIKELYG